MSPGDPNDQRLTLLEHLGELRVRLIRCTCALVIGLAVGLFHSDEATSFLAAPVHDASLRMEQKVLRIEVAPDGTLRVPGWSGDTLPKDSVSRIEFWSPGAEAPRLWLGNSPGGLIYTRPMDPLLLNVKVAVFLGLALAFPYFLWELYGFVNPGLLPHERRYLWPFILSGTLLFVAGAGFAWATLRFALEFMAQTAIEGAMIYNDVRAYLGFALTTMTAFGLVFQLPLAIVLATRLGLVRVETLASKRRIVFVVLLVVSAVVTPSQDPVTLLVLAGPLYVLFEISLVVSHLMDRTRAARLEDRQESAA